MAEPTSNHPPSPSQPVRLLNLIESIPCALWEIGTDSQGRAQHFTFLSSTAEALFGHPQEFLLHPPNWAEIVHPEDRGEFLRQSAEPFPDHGRKIYRHRIVAASGRIIPIEATVTLVRDGNGVPVAQHGVTLDVSEQYRNLERWKILAQTAEALIESTNLESTLRKVTATIVPASADICSIHLKNESGGPPIPVLTTSTPELEAMMRESSERFPPRPETREMILQVLESKQSFVVQVTDEFLRANSISEEHYGFQKRMGIHSAIITPLFVEQELLGVIMISGVGNRAAFTEEDRLFLEELARQASAAIYNVRLLNKSRELAQQMEAANQVKDQFIATLSHELRTPLSPVLSTIDLLAEDKEFPESLMPYLEVLRRNIQIETRLIDDLLDMTRVAKGKLRFVESDVDLHVLIAEVLEMCEQDFDRNSLRLVTQLHAQNSFVRGDRDRLSQVLWNLLHNATKFTPEGGVITVRTQNPVPGEILIEVEDTGHGIEPTELSKIFEPFEQRSRPGRDHRTGAHGGLGLGLAISRNIMELHGGTIEARSLGAGHGATFSLRLNVTQIAEPPVIIEPQKPAPTSRSGRILMVDDHLDTNLALKTLLERRGYRVITAASVAGGLELARQHTFDVLISDIGLPDGDGTDLLRAILADTNPSRRIRAIAVSGYGSQADIDRSIAAGFTYHLKKPIAFPDLERAIAEVLAIPEP